MTDGLSVALTCGDDGVGSRRKDIKKKVGRKGGKGKKKGE